MVSHANFSVKSQVRFVFLGSILGFTTQYHVVREAPELYILWFQAALTGYFGSKGKKMLHLASEHTKGARNADSFSNTYELV